MEGLNKFWSGKRIFITGHTGFKGGWLTLWLQSLGADVYGYALDPSAEPNLFTLANIEKTISTHCVGNILDLSHLQQSFDEFKPDIVFHMAAQALVRTAYQDPIETFSTNILGTAHVLQAIRNCPSVRSVIIVTTDKCYEQTSENRPFIESDRIGGVDPYSASKASAELVVGAMRNSFFLPANYATHGVSIASVRAGNVIGGGDWSQDRLIPDAIRAMQSDGVLHVRNPLHVRPWQHVLDALHGYLILAQKLYEEGVTYGEAWNFGPDNSSSQPVSTIVDRLQKQFGEKLRTENVPSNSAPHEATTLRLDCTKAEKRLYWRPKLNLDQALDWTCEWYADFLQNSDMQAITQKQITQFEKL